MYKCLGICFCFLLSDNALDQKALFKVLKNFYIFFRCRVKVWNQFVQVKNAHCLTHICSFFDLVCYFKTMFQCNLSWSGIYSFCPASWVIVGYCRVVSLCLTRCTFYLGSKKILNHLLCCDVTYNENFLSQKCHLCLKTVGIGAREVDQWFSVFPALEQHKPVCAQSLK